MAKSALRIVTRTFRESYATCALISFDDALQNVSKLR